MSDTSGGDTRWLLRLNDFQLSETWRQVAFKRYVWPDLADGEAVGQPGHTYPHILPVNHEYLAFCPPLADSIASYISHERVATRNDFLDLTSSQVACLNILFPLRQDRDWATQVLAPLIPGLRLVEDIHFGYLGPEGMTAWLGEPLDARTNPSCTQVDVALFWRDVQGKRHATLLDWLYTEPALGVCEGFTSPANPQRDRCKSLRVTEIDPKTDCFLGTEDGGGRRYWEHLAEAGWNRDRLASVRGCPFRGPLYSLMRQSLVATYLQKQEAVDEANTLLIGFNRNRHVLKVPKDLQPPAVERGRQTIIEIWNDLQADMSPVGYLPVEQLMVSVDQVGGNDAAWRLYVRRRYGV